MQNLKDMSNGVTVSLIEALAQSNEQLMDICRKLETREGVVSAVRDIELRNYESGSRIEMYVEVNLKTDKSVCWFIDCIFQEHDWIINSQVYLTDDFGQNTVEQYPELCSVNVESFINNLKKTILIVEDSTINFNFDYL